MKKTEYPIGKCLNPKTLMFLYLVGITSSMALSQVSKPMLRALGLVGILVSSLCGVGSLAVVGSKFDKCSVTEDEKKKRLAVRSYEGQSK